MSSSPICIDCSSRNIGVLKSSEIVISTYDYDVTKDWNIYAHIKNYKITLDKDGKFTLTTCAPQLDLSLPENGGYRIFRAPHADDMQLHLVYNPSLIGLGRTNRTVTNSVLKTDEPKRPWGFESLSFRYYFVYWLHVFDSVVSKFKRTPKDIKNRPSK